MLKPKTRAPFEVTPATKAATRSLESWEEHWGSPDHSRAAWLALEGQLVRPGPHRPETWWSYQHDVPEGLRVAVDQPDPRWCLTPGATPARGYHASVRRWRQQELDRLLWLTAAGHLTEPETATAMRHIDALDKTMAELD